MSHRDDYVEDLLILFLQDCYGIGGVGSMQVRKQWRLERCFEGSAGKREDRHFALRALHDDILLPIFH